MANRKPKARNSDMRIDVFLSKDEALVNDRDGLVCFQNFEHSLTGLSGLDALDQDNTFEDGDVISVPCYIRISRNKGYQAPKGRKVDVERNGETAPANTASEDLPH